MSALVGYASSDDDEDEISSERPAKVARTEAHGTTTTSEKEANVDRSDSIQQQQLHLDPPLQPQQPPPTSTASPAAGPSTPPPTSTLPPTDPTTPLSAPASPYTTERQRIQSLTMPTHPNFSIPSSPPPPQTNSEDAATLAATTKKFERFLELKKQGVHFNDRLGKSASLRNPGLLPKLMEFAGIGVEEGYASTLPEDLGVPTKWREESYVESLMKANERKNKEKRKDNRLDFVAATKSAGSSKASTPTSTLSEGRRSKFDKR